MTQNGPQVRLAHHDDGAGTLHWLEVITTTIAPVLGQTPYLSK